ncbi:hypothetical protein FRB91_002244 [Serendipita sp. 411]|nr:hypothetical protein FRB91_002244 [Serendipita sp. 411]
MSSLANGKLQTFRSMKDGLRSLLAQLQTLDSWETPSLMEPFDATLSSLSECEGQITDLSRQLSSKIEEYKGLKGTAKGPQTFNLGSPPISRCPDVLLGYIFEYIVEKGSHHISPLLTVDRRFHQLIMSNCFLWRKLFFTFGKDLKEVNCLSTRYVQACLERSRNALLDVVLDYSDVLEQFISPGEYISRLIRDSLPGSDLEGIDRVSVGVGDVAWDMDFSTLERILQGRFKIIQSLTGPECIHTRRWRSAIISFPANENPQPEMLDLFTGEMPNLQILQLDNVTFQLFCKRLPDSGWPTVTQFRFSSDLKLSRAPLNLGLLTVLRFEHCNEENNADNLATLAQCTSLRELEIECSGSKILDTPQIDIHLPLLTSFTLRRAVSYIDYVHFHLPKLKHLKLACRADQVLPNIDALHVEWEVWMGHWIEVEDEMNYLLHLLSGLKKAVSLTVKHLTHPEVCLAKCREMKVESKLPKCLQVIDIEDAGTLDLIMDD